MVPGPHFNNVQALGAHVPAQTYIQPMNEKHSGAEPLHQSASEGAGSNPAKAAGDYPDEPVNLKHAAAEFDAAASTLKNWVKSGRLKAGQTGPKAPYMVRLGDVATLLKGAPNVASVFHSNNDSSAPAHVSSKPERADEPVKPEWSEPIAAAADQSRVTQDRSVEPDESKLPVLDEEPQGRRRRRRRPRHKRGPVGVVSPRIDDHLASYDLRQLINLDRKIKSLIDLKLA